MRILISMFQKTLVTGTLIRFLFGFGIITFAIGLSIYFRSVAYNTGLSILAPLSKVDSIEFSSIPHQSSLAKADLEKLTLLFSILREKKEHHKFIFLELYKYHFASVTMLLILSSISAIFIFIVSQDGIRNTKPNFQMIFYLLAGMTTFYALSPVVYKQDTSIKSNLTSYLQLDNLQTQIYNYISINGVDSGSKDSLSFAKFHTSILNKVQDLNTIDLQFDYKAIPSSDFFQESKRIP